MELEELELLVRDLRRQVEGLTALVLHKAPGVFDPRRVQTLYVEAHKLNKIRASVADLWMHVIYSLDAHQLLELARFMSDPFPWRPFFFVLQKLRSQGVPVADCLKHLDQIARDLLAAQGMSLVTPADVLGSPPPIYTAIAAISEEEETRGKKERVRR